MLAGSVTAFVDAPAPLVGVNVASVGVNEGFVDTHGSFVGVNGGRGGVNAAFVGSDARRVGVRESFGGVTESFVVVVVVAFGAGRRRWAGDLSGIWGVPPLGFIGRALIVTELVRGQTVKRNCGAAGAGKMRAANYSVNYVF